MKTESLVVRMTTEERAALERWALQDPEARGCGAVVRRLIREEIQRERDRERSI